MQSFANGRLPAGNKETFADDMIQELADNLTAFARRAGQRGLRINFYWLSDALGEKLARAVLRRAGFRRLPDQWAIGDGDMRIENYAYPPAVADRLEGIVDWYE